MTDTTRQSAPEHPAYQIMLDPSLALPKAIVVVGLGELLSQRISMPFSPALGAKSDDFPNLPLRKMLWIYYIDPLSAEISLLSQTMNIYDVMIYIL